MVSLIQWEVGCGRVLRTSKMVINAIFSDLVDCISLEFTELMAIKLALELYVQTKWVGKFNFTIESDS
ncbi:hypothetical protein GQ457_16G001170 [Hibiscus cannabinus]